VQESGVERTERLADGPRLRELQAALADVEQAQQPGDLVFSVIAMLVVDAVLDGDEHTLGSAVRQLQRLVGVAAQEGHEHSESRGRLLGLLDVASWGLERQVSLEFLAEFEATSHAHEFLKAVAEKPGLSNSDLVVNLGTSEAEVSRVGRRLANAGIATKRRLGRRNYWEITPKGIQALEIIENGGVSRYFRPHYERMY